MNLNGKIAVITGGAIRVGRAITLSLAAAGCDVFIHFFQSASEASQVKCESEALGVKAATYSADLADIDDAQSIIPAAVETFGAVDILINNAAIFPVSDTFHQIDPVTWDSIFSINLRAPFLLSRGFAGSRHTNGIRKIVNVNDARISRPDRDHFAYRLAKRSLSDMTTILALELAPHTTVNAVALGAILPGPGMNDNSFKESCHDRVPLECSGSPESVTDNVLHLLKQDFLTGITITVDGGEYI